MPDNSDCPQCIGGKLTVGFGICDTCQYDPEKEQQPPESEALIEQIFGPKPEPKPATKTPHWRDAIKEPWATWGMESDEFKRQLTRYGSGGHRVQQLGYEFELLTGLHPVWDNKAKVKRWSTGLFGALQEAQWDKEIVLAVTEQMKEKGLTVTSPWSVHEMAREMCANRKRGPSKTTMAAGIQYE